MRVLNLSRPREGRQEGELVLLGLVNADPEAWKQVADVYVWGEYRESSPVDTPFEEVEVEAEIWVWSGTAAPKSFVVAGEVAAFADWMEKISERILELATEAPGGNAAPEEISRILRQRADQIQARLPSRSNPANFDPDSRDASLRRYYLSLLETARFFHPLDHHTYNRLMQAKRQWHSLHERGGEFHVRQERARDFRDVLENLGRASDGRPVWSRVRSALTAQAQLPDLLRAPLLERAGLPPDMPPEVRAGRRRALAEDFVREIERWFGSADPATEIERNAGDAARRVLASALNDGVDPDLLLRVIDVLWPFIKAGHDDYVEGNLSASDNIRWERLERGILDVFNRMGRLNDGLTLLGIDMEALRQVASQHDAPLSTTTHAATASVEADETARFRRLSPARIQESFKEFLKPPPHPAPQIGNLDVRPLMWGRSVIQIDRIAEALGVPGTRSLNTRGPGFLIDHLAWDFGYLWIAGRMTRNAPYSRFDPSQPRSLEADMTDFEPVVLRYSPLHDTFERMHPEEGFPARIGTVYPDGESLWVGLENEGLRKLDLANGNWTAFTSEDGLLSMNIHSASKADGTVLFAAQEENRLIVNAYDENSESWRGIEVPDGRRFNPKTELTVSGDRIAFGGSYPALFRPSTREWELLDAPGFADAGELPLVTRALSGTAEGFWSITNYGVFLYQPDSDAYPGTKVHGLSSWPAAVASSDRALWVGMNDASAQTGSENGVGFLLVFHRDFPDWCGYIPFPGRILAIEDTFDSVWVSVDNPIEPLWEVAKPDVLRMREGQHSEPNAESLPSAAERLLAASWKGDLATVEAILESGVHPDSGATDAGWTPLMAAVRGGHEGVVRVLLENGADPSASGGSRIPGTALHSAVDLGRRPIVRMLLRAGAPIDATEGTFRKTPLHLAARNGDMMLVSLLLDHGGDPNTFDASSWTPLQYAMEMGAYELIPLLVRHGANLDLQGPQGNTVLHDAVLRGQDEVIRFLLAHGADPRIPSVRGTPAVPADTLAELAPADPMFGEIDDYHGVTSEPEERLPDQVRSPDLSPRRISSDVADFLLFEAVRGNDTRMAIRALAAGADPDLQDAYRRPILARAAAAGNTAVVAELLDRGADIDLVGRDRFTALMQGAHRGHTETVRLLLANGADVMLRLSNDNTAVKLAIERGHEDIVTLFEEGPRAIPDGSDLLIDALEYRYPERVWHLLADEGVDPNLPSTEKRLPLHYLLASGHDYGAVEIVGALIEHGADVSRAEPATGKLPLLIATERAVERRIFELLIEHGADVNTTDEEGRGILWHAHTIRSWGSRNDIVEILVENGAILYP